jgi:major membrane immunogen (membrane-anchored lipoprotein)
VPTKLNPNQVNEDTLEDADGDTKVMVEESGDEDKIRFDTGGTERVIINSTGVGIGTSSPTELLTINGADDNAMPYIDFLEGDAARAKIGINSSNNLEILQSYTNKHIVFKVNDAGTSREAFRMDGAVPEVVVNQTGDSLVDFRVESDNQTHMLFVDGGNDRVGILKQSPQSELDVGGTIRASGDLYVDKIRRYSDSGTTTKILLNDEAIKIYAGHSSDNICTVDSSGLQVFKSVAFPTGTLRTGAYTITADDFCIVADCNSSAFTLTLPVATDAMAGRIYTIKRMDSGNSGGGNMLTISRNGKNIDNVAGDVLLANLEALVLQCIGADGGWIRIGAFLPPMP